LKKRCQNKITVNGYGFWKKFKEPVGSLKDLVLLDQFFESFWRTMVLGEN
jgi:hypothetical protein